MRIINNKLIQQRNILIKDIIEGAFVNKKQAIYLVRWLKSDYGIILTK